jgi:hypothetical protein
LKSPARTACYDAAVTGDFARRPLKRGGFFGEIAAEKAVEQLLVVVAHAGEADAVRARPLVLGELDAVDAQDAIRSRQLKLERDVLMIDVGLEDFVEQHAAARYIDRATRVRLAVDVLVEQDVDRHAPFGAVVFGVHRRLHAMWFRVGLYRIE